MSGKVLGVLAVALMLASGVRAGTADWETDFAQASKRAGESGLYMLLDFSGSDWCGWCMKLDQEVFSDSGFENFAQQNLVCVSVDFPHEKEQSDEVKEQNAALSEKYNVDGYPTVIILSPEGELVARTGYQEGGAEKYVAYLKEIQISLPHGLSFDTILKIIRRFVPG